MTAQIVSSVDDLASKVVELKRDAQRVVHCHGVFDLLHIGHIRYLQRARQLGDVLVVTATPDHYVNKGPHRPAFPVEQRLAALAALDCVDYVAVNAWPTAAELIERIRPDVYCKGAEFRDTKTPELEREESICRSVGTVVEFIEDVTSSSSYLINNHLGMFPEELEAYLQQFKQQQSAESLFALLDRVRDLRVLVIGEAIIDEYYECESIGQSERAPIIAARYTSHDRYAGGALAVANHVAAFTEHVELVTLLGSQNSQEAWIREQLHANVQPQFIHARDAPTIVKRRYRESYFNTPLFEIDFFADQPLAPDADLSLREHVASRMSHVDLVIVADYGHSMLGQATRELIVEQAPRVCIMPQVTASNVGFHTIGKYRNSHHAQLAHRELEVECRRRADDVEAMAREVRDALGIETLVITLGRRGCLAIDTNAGVTHAASLATQVVDRFGAGEAFFSISSLALAVDASIAQVLFLGNAAAAEAVAVIGNSRYLESLPFRRHIQSLLK
ncbi:MAG: PfkB family carbohydrate kinase [Planctomycetota bacterium]|nr:PfkB family carbohydrate kinase [Planctomycetota bacterium]